MDGTFYGTPLPCSGLRGRIIGTTDFGDIAVSVLVFGEISFSNKLKREEISYYMALAIIFSLPEFPRESAHIVPELSC